MDQNAVVRATCLHRPALTFEEMQDVASAYMLFVNPLEKCLHLSKWGNNNRRRPQVSYARIHSVSENLLALKLPDNTTETLNIVGKAAVQMQNYKTHLHPFNNCEQEAICFCSL